MAYPYSVADINELQALCLALRNYLNGAATDLMSAGSQTLWSNAKSLIYSAGSNLSNAAALWMPILVGTLTTRMIAMFTGIRTNWPTGGAAATMDDILNAMLVASFTQLQQFIGIEDAYRVALWNAPFNVDFYAALARGFVKWP